MTQGGVLGEGRGPLVISDLCDSNTPHPASKMGNMGVQVVRLAWCVQVLSGPWRPWVEGRTTRFPPAARVMVKRVTLHLIPRQLSTLGWGISHLSLVQRGDVTFPEHYI